jgi:hypothetical protein
MHDANATPSLETQNRPRGIIAAEPVVVPAVSRRSAVRAGHVADGLGAGGALRIAFFASSMALVMWISREHASVQLKMVRQRHTPSRSFRISNRSSVVRRGGATIRTPCVPWCRAIPHQDDPPETFHQ